MMAGWRSFALTAAFTVVGLMSAPLVASAQQAPADVTHLVCITNETGEALTVWINETPAARPRAGFSSGDDRATHCYSRVATAGRNASVVLSGLLQPDNPQTNEDRQRVVAYMRALPELPVACEIPAALIAAASVTQEAGVLLRVFAGEGGKVCAASTGAPPVGAIGIGGAA